MNPRPPTDTVPHDEARCLELRHALGDVAFNRHLATLLERCEALQADIRRLPVKESIADMADAAHTLGGSAGIFGFCHLATAASRFEQATVEAAPDLDACAEDLAAAVASAARTLRRLIASHVSRE